MDKKNALIIGASGLIGGYLYELLKKGGDFKLLGTYFGENYNSELGELDICDEKAVEGVLRFSAPDIVILPAANPNVDFCETNPAETRAINIDGAKNVIRHLPKNALFVYFSSDYVFDGEGGAYSEEDAPRPINEYGRQKLEMEEFIKNNLERYIIVRTSGVYGWHWGRKNYVTQVIDRLKRGDEVMAVTDQIYCPTYAGELAEAVKTLIDKGKTGIFNIVGREAVNRLEFAKKIAQTFSLDAAKIKGILTSEISVRAKRPMRSDMKTDKINSCGIFMSDVSGGLEKMKTEAFKVLMFSLDKSILDQESVSAKRMAGYGFICDEIHIVVAGSSGKGWTNGNVAVYATSDERIKSLRQAKEIGEKILMSGEKKWVITCQDPFEIGFIGWRLAKKFNAGLEVQLHGDFYSSDYWQNEKLLNQARYYLGKFVLKKADSIRVVSQRIKNSLSFLKNKKIFENPIYFDAEKSFSDFCPEENIKPQESIRLLAVGSLVPVKNHQQLIEAFAEIRKDLPNAKLIIVGEGPERKKLELQTTNYKLQTSTWFAGHQNNLADFYSSADMLVHPSFYEGWGRVVVEAASYGLPIIMSDVGLAGEVIKNEESGLVVSVNDKEALKAAILRLAKDGNLRKKLAENAKKAVAGRLSTKAEFLAKIKESWEAAIKNKI